VIDVRDDAKIAYELRVHVVRLSHPLCDCFYFFQFPAGAACFEEPRHQAAQDHAV
jgi:hypothetical protein